MSLPAILFIFFFLNSFSRAEPLMIKDSACRCDKNISALGPDEQAMRFNFGVYAGECVDSCRFQGAIVERDGPTQFAFNNYFHSGKYWKAELDPNKVESAQVGFEEFAPGIFHVLLVFRFPKKYPVKLMRAKERTQFIGNLVISVEGVPPKSKGYNLWDAYWGRYVIAARVLSLASVEDWSVKTKKNKVSLYNLKLEGSRLESSLRKGLRYSSRASFSEKYALFTNNCATNAVDFLLQDANPATINFSLWDHLGRALPISGPWGSLHYWNSLGLISLEPSIRL